MPGRSCLSLWTFNKVFFLSLPCIDFFFRCIFCFALLGEVVDGEKKKLSSFCSWFYFFITFPLLSLCIPALSPQEWQGTAEGWCHQCLHFRKCHGNRCRIIFCQHHNPHCERTLQGQIVTKDLYIFQIWPWRRVASFSWSLGQGELEIWIDLLIPTVSLKQNLADGLLQFCFIFSSVFFEIWIWLLEVQFLSGISSTLSLHQIKGGFWVSFWFIALSSWLFNSAE